MSSALGLFSPAAGGWFGVLKSWLQGRTGETWQTSEVPSSATAGSNADFFGSVRVLVVDDNPVNLMVISAQLESRGIVPLLAGDGAEAVALACELPFDLILMDLQMPILDGWAATAAIRRFETDRSRPAVPVVAYSITSPGAIVLATHGLSGSLIKPCPDEALEACLAQWCPSYCPAPAARGIAHGNDDRQQAQRPGPGGALLR